MQYGAYKVALVAAANTTAGAVLSLANPEKADLLVTRLVLDITTAGPGSTTVDAGIAANGTTSADNLIDAGAVSAIGVIDNIEDGGTNGQAVVKWTSTQFLTITASAALTGLVGNAYIEYIRV